VHWICLQYDECKLELESAWRQSDVELHRFDDVDFFNDLDEVAALNAALDLVISRRSAVSALSAALAWKRGSSASARTGRRTERKETRGSPR